MGLIRGVHCHMDLPPNAARERERERRGREMGEREMGEREKCERRNGDRRGDGETEE